MIGILYLAAAAAFIVGLKRLSSPKTARAGNLLSGAGMLLAVVVTLVDADIVGWPAVIAGVITGSVIGALAAQLVQMTAMPQMVAAFNGFGGVASALLAAAELIRAEGMAVSHEFEVAAALSLAIGAPTFTGSFVAYGKLQGLLPGRPIGYPGHRIVNAGLLVVMAACGVTAISTDALGWYWALAVAAVVVGVTGVLPIGGADMPVVISLLNAFSGLAAAAAGFVVDNSALIIGGALVGSAGLILTFLMTEAMNRSLGNVLFSGFGTGDGGGPAGDASEVSRATALDVAINLGYASRVVVVPGYGLAVAQAQHAVRKLATELEERGVEVTYAIHPVAGRMPGHMNVLLAEADVPYEQLRDLEHANADFDHVDAALVVGANDVVNPSARDDSSSPIYGMPILEVDRAATVIVIKRSLSPGFAGIDNPLFYSEGTLMFFADARDALEQVAAALNDV